MLLKNISALSLLLGCAFTSHAQQTAPAVTLTVTEIVPSYPGGYTLSASVAIQDPGLVEFLDGFEILGSARLSVNTATNRSMGSLKVQLNVPKTHRLRAVYLGSYPKSVSAPVAVLVKFPVTQSFGEGAFDPHAIYADVNKDGHLDYIDTSGAKLWTSVGSFSNAADTFVYMLGAAQGMVADFNFDGFPDILDGLGQLSLGNGAGAFQQRVATSLGGVRAYSVDLNRDGRPDPIYVSSSAGDALQTAFGQFGVNFSPPAGLFKTIYAVADLNGNDTADVIGANGSQRPYLVTQTKLDLTSAFFNSAVENPEWAFAGDVNADGFDDIVSVRYVPATPFYEIVLEKANSTGALLAPVVIVPPGSWTAHQVVDWDGDGKADILLSKPKQYNTSILGYLPGRGDGTFGNPVTVVEFYDNRGTPDALTRLKAADLNGDGYLDLFIGHNIGDSYDATLTGTPTAIAPEGFTIPLSLTPSNASGAGGQFFVNYQAEAFSGQPNPVVSRAYLLFSSTSDSINATKACFVEIDPNTNKFRLAVDQGNAFRDSSYYGGAFLSNGQCTLANSGTNAGAVVIDGERANYQSALTLSFLRGFNGVHAVYLLTQGGDGSSSGWLRVGTYTVQSTATAPVFPAGIPIDLASDFASIVGSFVPVSASFNNVYGLPGTYLGYILILATPNIANYNAAGSCLIEYNRLNNSMRLIDDTGTGWIGGASVQAGSAGATLSNSSCTVNVAQAVVETSEFGFKITALVTLANGFGPQYVVFSQQLDAGGHWSSMRQVASGITTVNAISIRPGPQVSANPPGQFGTFQVSATPGSSPLTDVHLMIGRRLDESVSCHIVWSVAGNSVALINDQANGIVGGAYKPIGVPGTLSNFRCNVNVGGASISQNGTERTLSVPVTSLPPSAGLVQVFTNAFDSAGLLTHWRATGGFQW